MTKKERAFTESVLFKLKPYVEFKDYGAAIAAMKVQIEYIRGQRFWIVDYYGQPYRDTSGRRVAKGLNTTVEAYDLDHAKCVFEAKYPDVDYDEPYQ